MLKRHLHRWISRQMQHLDEDQRFSQVLVEAVILLGCLQLLLAPPGRDLQLLPACTGEGTVDKITALVPPQALNTTSTIELSFLFLYPGPFSSDRFTATEVGLSPEG